MKRVADIIEQAKNTYIERNSKLGNTWYQVGQITRVLYPKGITLHSTTDFAKFHILQWMIGKLVRFTNSNDLDSIHDAGVYCFILESIVHDELADRGSK